MPAQLHPRRVASTKRNQRNWLEFDGVFLVTNFKRVHRSDCIILCAVNLLMLARWQRRVLAISINLDGLLIMVLLLLRDEPFLSICNMHITRVGLSQAVHLPSYLLNLKVFLTANASQPVDGASSPIYTAFCCNQTTVLAERCTTQDRIDLQNQYHMTAPGLGHTTHIMAVLLPIHEASAIMSCHPAKTFNSQIPLGTSMFLPSLPRMVHLHRLSTAVYCLHRITTVAVAHYDIHITVLYPSPQLSHPKCRFSD